MRKTDPNAQQCANEVTDLGGVTCVYILNGGGYSCEYDDCSLIEPSAKIPTNAMLVMNVMLTREHASKHLDLTLTVVKMPAGTKC